MRTVTLPRVYAVSHERRARRIDYRHVIAQLARKPQAFRYSQLRRLEDALQKLDKYRVLILDDFGYVKKTEQETQVLFEVIAHRYETGSLIITSNQPFAEWDRIFPDQMMTVAAVDRLIHHAALIEISSDSYRRKEALRQAATNPAATLSVPATTTPDKIIDTGYLLPHKFKGRHFNPYFVPSPPLPLAVKSPAG